MKAEEMDSEREMNREKARESWGKCQLLLWGKNSNFGTVVCPNGEKLYWGVFSNMAYDSFFKGIPKEKVFKKVIRMR